MKSRDTVAHSHEAATKPRDSGTISHDSIVYTLWHMTE